MPKSSRTFDITLYGATGFTGQLVAQYLSKKAAQKKLKIAIAGRNADKLFALKNKLLALNPKLLDIGVVIASTAQQDSLEKMAGDTRVIINTVGPYYLHGEPLVKACINQRTHSVDLNGEPDYSQNIFKYYNFPAERSGTMIISSCGFDSVPADLGAFYTAKLLGEGNNKTIRCYVTVKGGISGGTWNSAMKIFDEVNEAFLTEPPFKFGNGTIPGFHNQKDIKLWAVPLPVIDPMIVRRSTFSRKDIYGENFSFGHFAGMKSSWIAGGFVAGVGILYGASRIDFIRKQLLKLIESGEGPSEKQRAKSFFKLYFVGESQGKQVKATVSGGDPGYTETSKMISEAALTIVDNYDQLNKGGVLAPAGALGELYLDNLQQNGIHFEQI